MHNVIIIESYTTWYFPNHSNHTKLKKIIVLAVPYLLYHTLFPLYSNDPVTSDSLKRESCDVRWNFHHWLHRKLSFWQLSVQPVMEISSNWRHFRVWIWLPKIYTCIYKTYRNVPIRSATLIEAPPSESAHCQRIVAPPQNRSAGRL